TVASTSRTSRCGTRAGCSAPGDGRVTPARRAAENGDVSGSFTHTDDALGCVPSIPPAPSGVPMRPTLARRPALFAVLAVLAALALPVQAAQADRGSHGPGAGIAQHSLRTPVTDEDFYFVMADRFQNGDPDNDTGE